MAKVYTINSGGNDPDGPDLVGLQIIDLGSNDGYELVQVLATNSSNTLPLTFNFNNFKDWNWTVRATTKTEGTNRTMSGTWTNTDNQTSFKNDEGDWTATGTGTGSDDEDEAHAASAS